MPWRLLENNKKKEKKDKETKKGIPIVLGQEASILLLLLLLNTKDFLIGNGETSRPAELVVRPRRFVAFRHF
jgi:hypothetical protein